MVYRTNVTLSVIRGREPQGANLARGAEYEELYGFTRVRIIVGEQRTHVARNSGYTQETAAVVEQVFDLGSIHGPLAHEVGHGARIKSARSSSHEQPVKRGEAHRGIDATSIMHGAETRAISEVSDNHATIREIGIDCAEPLRHELV